MTIRPPVALAGFLLSATSCPRCAKTGKERVARITLPYRVDMVH